jgi:anti-sigma regulatory factor (Ser/Thr protein kinase)
VKSADGLNCLKLAALPSAVASGRQYARHMLVAWGLPEIGDDVLLVVSELVTNAGAPRGALSYPRRSREELEGGSWV